MEKVRVGKFKDLNTLPTTLSSMEQMVRWVVAGGSSSTITANTDVLAMLKT